MPTASEATRDARIRVLIVDDEPLARDRTRQLLEEEPDVEIVGECASGEDAVAAIESAAPDLVFLDVQMPGMDGFGVLARIGASRLPAVVFVTAHDEHALRAFQVHALDYLLKPFDGARLRGSLQRVREQLRSAAPHVFQRRLLAMLADLKPRAGPATRIVIRSGGRLSFLKADEIDWIEGAGVYATLHVGRTSCLYRAALSELAERLDPRRFVRVHRSAIVNLESVVQLEPLSHGEFEVVLRNGARPRISRTFRAQLEARLGQSL